MQNTTSIRTTRKKEIPAGRQQQTTEAPLRRVLALGVPVLITLLLLVYIMYANHTSPSSSSSFHDIGSEEDLRRPFLRNGMHDINYTSAVRNMSKPRAEFVVPVPYDLKALRVEARFSDPGLPVYVLANKTDFVIYHPFIESMAAYNKTAIINGDGQNINEYRRSTTEPSALLIATDFPFQNTPRTANLTIRPRVINAALQGEHHFLVYTTGQFYMRVLKRDMNRQEGPDSLSITITAINGTPYGELTIPDDEEANMTRQVQQGTLTRNLTSGVYMLTIPSFDGVIKQLVLSTNKVVTHDINILNAGNTEPKTLYVSSLRKGRYTITRYGGTTDEILVDGKPARGPALVLSKGYHTITIPTIDVTISGPGWLSFAPDSYFEPYAQEFVPLTTTTTAIADRVWSDYTLASRSESLLTNAVTLPASSIGAVDGRATISLYVPSRTSFSPAVGIDWVNVTVIR